MTPSKDSTTRFEWLPEDPMAFAPMRLWKLPFITTWDEPRNQNPPPIDSAEEGEYNHSQMVPLLLRWLRIAKSSTASPAPLGELTIYCRMGRGV